MDTVTWYESVCDTCGVKCFVYDGDTADLTRQDIDQFICWNCEKVHITIGYCDHADLNAPVMSTFLSPIELPKEYTSYYKKWIYLGPDRPIWDCAIQISESSIIYAYKNGKMLPDTWWPNYAPEDFSRWQEVKKTTSAG